MGIDYSTCVGEGFVVSYEEFEKLREQYPDVLEDNDYVTYVNCYYADTDIFIGPCKGFYAFEPTELNDLRDAISLEDHDQFVKWMKEEGEKIFGERKISFMIFTNMW